MKSDYVQVRISDAEKAELGQLVERMPDPDMTLSKFVRDAIREKATRERRKLTPAPDAERAATGAAS